MNSKQTQRLRICLRRNHECSVLSLSVTCISVTEAYSDISLCCLGCYLQVFSGSEGCGSVGGCRAGCEVEALGCDCAVERLRVETWRGVQGSGYLEGGRGAGTGHGSVVAESVHAVSENWVLGLEAGRNYAVTLGYAGEPCLATSPSAVEGCVHALEGGSYHALAEGFGLASMEDFYPALEAGCDLAVVESCLSVVVGSVLAALGVDCGRV